MNTKDFATLVREQVTAIQGAYSGLVDLTIGSILRAVVEANAAMVLWIQGLILALLAATRAATSNGTDLDTWAADYGLSRLAASAATGQITFARFSASLQAVVPIGANVQTGDGTQSYSVAIDPSNGAYSSGMGGYVIAIGAYGVNVPVIASAAGTGANALAGMVNTLTTPIVGVDTVNNAAAFTNGVDPETDTAFRARFILYVASLSKATKNAVGYAVNSLQQGLSYVIVENYLYNGTYQPGFFYAVIDDGTGYPSGTVLTACANAIDAVRPFCSTFAVYAPSVVTANVSVIIATDTGYTHGAVVALVGPALTAYINGLAIGKKLAYSRIAQVCYDASPGVVNVTGVTVNGGTSDITATNQQVIVAGTVTVA